MSDVKNFGLKGIASDVQFGKSGGRIQFTGGAFSVVGSNGSTPVKIAGAAATESNEYVTLSQLESVQAGLDLKESVRLATTSALPAYTADGSGSGKTLTADANGALTVDGFAVDVNDRLLVKNEATADADHGIYVVTATGDASNPFVLTRADDADGTPSHEVTTGMHTFVSEGTVNGGTGWVLVTSDTITVDTTALQFTQFSGGGSYTANEGVQLVGNNFRLDLDSLTSTAGTVLGADFLALGDGTGGGPDSKVTLNQLMDDLNIVNVGDYSAGIEFIANTAADTYSKYTLVASAVAGDEGASVAQNGSTIEFGLDITGLTAVGTSDGADELVLFDGTNNRKTTITDLMADNNIANLSSDGIAVRTAAGTYAARTIVAGTGDEAGLVVTNGNGVAGNPTVGLDIVGLTDIGTDVVLGTDYLVVSDASDGNTNKKVSVQEIVDLATGSISTNTISQGDSSITVVDAGTGTITTVVDATTVMTTTATETTVNSLAVSDLTATRVVFAGTDGALVDDAELTYTVGSNLLNAANIDASGNIGAATIQTDGAGITVTGTGTITTATGNISSTSGNISTGGNISTSGSGTITAAGGVIDSTLTVSNGVVFAAGGNLNQDAGFTYNPTTDTLTVNTIAVTDIGTTDTLVQFGNATGGLSEDADLSYDSTNNVLTIGNLDIDGTTQTITGNVTNGDITLVPNGTGEVIIGSSGAGSISSETTESMTLAGGTDLFLDSGSGSVFIRDDANNTPLNVAQFNANASADTHFTFTSDTAANGLEIGTSGNTDIRFVLGTSNLLVVDNATNYNAALASAGTDAIVTKGYVDSAISAGAVTESIKSVLATVSLAADGTTNIGAALPAGATVVRTKVVVTTTDATATLDVGVSGTPDRYMADTENDPAASGIYLSENFDTDGSSVQIIATVAGSNNDVGASCQVLVEYRVAA